MSVLQWILVLFVLGIILAAVGLPNASDLAFGGAKVLFNIVVFGFLILFALFLAFGVLGK